MVTGKSDSERGIALFMSLVILLLLSALAISLVYMSNTDTFVTTNYRNQQNLYFAAKAGVEEARNRLVQSAGANSIVSPACGGGAAGCLPAAPQVPSDANRGVLYILGGANPGAVAPWNGSATNIFRDDELCHNGYNLSGINGTDAHSGDVHCDKVPNGATWYASTNSIAPWAGTNAALPYQWVRVSLKLNGSVNNYPVNPVAPLNRPACWDGTREIVGVNANNCTGTLTASNPVYLITALAVNPQTNSRRMVQSEVALDPTPPFPYGMFATGTGCNALWLAGGATTDSYTSANGQNYSTTQSNTGGDVGSNGNVYMNGTSTQIGGSVGVPVATQGPCPGSGLTVSGGAGFLPPTTSNTLTAAGPYTFPTPPSPVPPPPNTNEPKVGKTGANFIPGTYGNISVTAGGTITIAPGTYNINSISLSGNSNLVISPSGSVVFNIYGKDGSGNYLNTPVDFSGGSITNNSLIANNFLVNYAGTGDIKLSGGTATYVTVYAPNAHIDVTGGSHIYGAVIGREVWNKGGTAFHYDKNTQLGPQSNGYYTQIALRDIQY